MKKKPVRRVVGALGVGSWLVAATLLAPPWVGAARAPAALGATVVVAAAGDIAHKGSPSNNQRQTANLVTNTIHPDHVFVLGDAQYEHGELAQFQRSYDPTWGAFKNITSPVLGNHEYETNGASGYFNYFASQLSGRGPNASKANAGYYSFDAGDWHIVALNSNCHFANCTAQATWLKNDVAADNHQCELVMYHNPSEKRFQSAAATAKVDVILAGHRHRYERWDRIQGDVRLFVVGTGGKSAGTPNPKADGKFKGYGVLRLDLSSTGYTWEFIAVGGQTKDSGSETCTD